MPAGQVKIGCMNLTSEKSGFGHRCRCSDTFSVGCRNRCPWMLDDGHDDDNARNWPRDACAEALVGPRL
jgi:hypothetical protein